MLGYTAYAEVGCAGCLWLLQGCCGTVVAGCRGGIGGQTVICMLPGGEAGVGGVGPAKGK